MIVTGQARLHDSGTRGEGDATHACEDHPESIDPTQDLIP